MIKKTNNPPHGSYLPKNQKETRGHIQSGIFNFHLNETANLPVLLPGPNFIRLLHLCDNY